MQKLKEIIILLLLVNTCATAFAQPVKANTYVVLAGIVKIGIKNIKINQYL